MNMGSASVRPFGPAGACPDFTSALSRGDLQSASACFARDGCLITPDATAIHGRDQIRPLLAQMVVRQTEIRVESASAIGAGEIILAQEHWRVRAGQPESARVEQNLDATLVLGLIEGEWKLTIVAPWGWGQTRLARLD
jgi:ketosteroid isomerase-like protein